MSKDAKYYDEKCLALAQAFILDYVPSSSPRAGELCDELATVIQRAIEDFLNEQPETKL